MREQLVTLGYLAPGGDEQRALRRFQRHARRAFRMTAGGERLEITPSYSGRDGGAEDDATRAEIALWVERGWRIPAGYFKFTRVGTWGRLREDVAREWLALMARVKDLGGTIDGPYGDTKRPLLKTVRTGASKYSFHIVGRAVDLNQGLRGTRYFVVSEPGRYWRIYCTAARGERFEGRGLPPGTYLDLTAEIERDGRFERIRAQRGWEQRPIKSEWWHFQYKPDKQKTFQDECELVGITEAQLRAAGYTDKDLDHAPG